MTGIRRAPDRDVKQMETYLQQADMQQAAPTDTASQAAVDDVHSTDANSALISVAGRITTVLKQERQALEALRYDELKTITDKKNQLTHALMRAMHRIDAVTLTNSARQAIDDVRTEAESSRQVLERHLSAAREINALIDDAVTANISDGTYADRDFQAG